jgi:hypothetical protein
MNTTNNTASHATTTGRTPSAGLPQDHAIESSGNDANSLLDAAPATSDDLSPKQFLALNALVTGKRKHEAAAAAGVNRRTLSRGLQSPVFRATLNAELKDIAQLASRRSALVTIHALDTLDRLLVTSEDPAVTIQAALAILKHRPEPIEYGPLTPQAIARDELLNELLQSFYLPIRDQDLPHAPNPRNLPSHS